MLLRLEKKSSTYSKKVNPKLIIDVAPKKTFEFFPEDEIELPYKCKTFWLG